MVLFRVRSETHRVQASVTVELRTVERRAERGGCEKKAGAERAVAVAAARCRAQKVETVRKAQKRANEKGEDAAI